MCLNRPLDVKKIQNKGIGWKVFQKIERRLVGPYISTTFTTRKTFKDKSTRELQYELVNGYYPTGFHIFDKKEDAIKLAKYKNRFDRKAPYLVYRVKYSKITAYGSQDLGEFNQTVVVARNIKLLRKVNLNENL